MKKHKVFNKKRVEEAREELRQWAVKYTGCDIQEGVNGKKYP